MIITIDNGNTRPHVGIFSDDHQMLEVIPLAEFNLQKIHSISPQILLSSVGQNIPGFELLKPFLIDLSTYRQDKKFLDMSVDYGLTLGNDRLYQSYFLYKNKNYQKKKLMLIDTGTFITIDFISRKGYLGGFIFPGIQTFLQSYSRGANLPQLTPPECLMEELERVKFPHTTEEAILGAASIYLNSLYREILKNYSGGIDEIILTGGNAEKDGSLLKKIDPQIKFEIFPHLIHNSLHFLGTIHNQLKSESHL